MIILRVRRLQLETHGADLETNLRTQCAFSISTSPKYEALEIDGTNTIASRLERSFHVLSLNWLRPGPEP